METFYLLFVRYEWFDWFKEKKGEEVGHCNESVKLGWFLFQPKCIFPFLVTLTISYFASTVYNNNNYLTILLFN